MGTLQEETQTTPVQEGLVDDREYLPEWAAPKSTPSPEQQYIFIEELILRILKSDKLSHLLSARAYMKEYPFRLTHMAEMIDRKIALISYKKRLVKR